MNTDEVRKMKNKVLKIIAAIVIVLETALIVFLGFIVNAENSEKTETEVFRESKNGQQVVICQVGEPDFPFGYAHYKVYGPSDFSVDVADDGGKGSYEVTWQADSVTVTFCGEEQSDAVYVLPFEAK